MDTIIVLWFGKCGRVHLVAERSRCHVRTLELLFHAVRKLRSELLEGVRHKRSLIARLRVSSLHSASARHKLTAIGCAWPKSKRPKVVAPLFGVVCDDDNFL
jgi:hypothetical protein